MYSHKEMTKHIRKLVKLSGIKARINMMNYCGAKIIKVVVPSYDSSFSSDEIKRIAEIARNNKLTGCMYKVIDPEHEMLLTEKKEWQFEFHA